MSDLKVHRSFLSFSKNHHKNIQLQKVHNYHNQLGQEYDYKVLNAGILLFEKVQKLNVGEIIVTDIFAEGKNKGFNTNLFKQIRKSVDTQLVAHGGAGPKENILEMFVECNVDAISIASLFHYHYLKSNRSSELKGSNYFIHFLNDDEKRGMSILELKKYLKL